MIDLNKIYYEDCLKFMNKVPSDYVNLVFADPPFLFDEDYYLEKNEKTYLDWCNQWIKEGWRILKPDGYFMVMATYNYMEDINNMLESLGLKIADIWWSSNLYNMQDDYIEPILVFTKDKNGEYEGEIKWEDTDYIDYEKHLIKKGRSEDDSSCFTQIPMRLGFKIVHNYSDNGGLVYDMFSGSGVIVTVCKNTGRNYIATEIKGGE